MVTEEKLVNKCVEKSVEKKRVEEEEKLGWYPALVWEMEGGDVWELFVVIGMTVEEIFVGITEMLKPVEIGCGDGDELRKLSFRVVDRKNDGEVGLAWDLPLDPSVIFAVVDVVASVRPVGHTTHIFMYAAHLYI